MAHSSSARTGFRSLLVVIAATAVLSGCGGSSSNGSQTAGIEGTGIVSGFGSVYVGGIEFASNGARVRFNGSPTGEQRLRVGDVVTVSGRIDSQGNAAADRITFERILDGPITSIELGNDGSGELAALGQSVRFDADTTFIDTTADTLAAGDLIAVSGFTDDDGNLQATSIESGGVYEPGTSEVDLQGTVRALGANSLRIGALTVRLGAADIDDSAGTLRDGAFVQVAGTLGVTPDSPLDASSVTVRDRRLGNDGEQVFIEGTVANYSGLGNFTVNGQQIDASSAQRSDDTGIALAPGVNVWVRGERSGDRLIPRTLRVQPRPAYTLRARIANVDAATNTVEVLDTQWNVQPGTLYLDRRDSNPADNNRRLRIGSLAAGDTVSVNGYAAGNGRIMSRLERVTDDATGDARVRGAIASVTRDSGSARLSIVGVGVVTRDGVTRFLSAAGEPIDAATFFANARAGVKIDARGPANGGQIDTARAVQLLD